MAVTPFTPYISTGRSSLVSGIADVTISRETAVNGGSVPSIQTIPARKIAWPEHELVQTAQVAGQARVQGGSQAPQPQAMGTATSNNNGDLCCCACSELLCRCDSAVSCLCECMAACCKALCS